MPKRRRENNATPLYAALNVEWAPKALYPQPRAQMNQKTTYLELMKALLDKGADPNIRLNKKVWYSGYSFDLSGVDETGATPFWRAAYASDVDAMQMLVAYGADPNIRTKRIAGRPRAGDIDRDVDGRVRSAAGAGGRPRRDAAAGRGRRRLRRGLRGELPSLRPGRDARRRSSTSSRSCTPTSTRSTTKATRRCTTPPRAATSR